MLLYHRSKEEKDSSRRLMENTVSSFSVCLSFCLQQIYVAFLSATINCRCLRL